MITEQQGELLERCIPNEGPRCPTCEAFPRLAQRFLDPIKGRTIRLYQCKCSERIWDE
jgi:hypothetical protein